MRVSKDLLKGFSDTGDRRSVDGKYPFHRGKRFFLRFSKVSPQFYRYKVTRELELN